MIVDRDRLWLRAALLVVALGGVAWFALRPSEDAAPPPGVSPEEYDRFRTRTRDVHQGDRLDAIVTAMGRPSDEEKRDPNTEYHLWRGPGGATLEVTIDVTTGRATRAAARFR